RRERELHGRIVAAARKDSVHEAVVVDCRYGYTCAEAAGRRALYLLARARFDSREPPAARLAAPRARPAADAEQAARARAAGPARRPARRRARRPRRRRRHHRDPARRPARGARPRRAPQRGGRPPRDPRGADRRRARAGGRRLGPAGAVLRGRPGHARRRRARPARPAHREGGAGPAHPQPGARDALTALARVEELERVVEVDGLVVRFGEVEAVAGISFEVGSGEVFGLLGPNGAGKTTTIRVLTTLLRPNEGSAFVAGHDVVRDGLAVRQSIGYVPQAISIDGALTAYENLEFYGRAMGVPRQERHERIEEAVDAMQLASFLDRLGRTLSGGML